MPGGALVAAGHFVSKAASIAAAMRRGAVAKWRTKKAKKRPTQRKSMVSGGLARMGARLAGPFLTSEVVEMPYRTVVSLVSGTTSLFNATAHTVRLNSIFDPDTSGHQPYGYDTVATVYNKYKVLACRVQIRFNNPAGDYLYAAVQVAAPAESDIISSKSITTLPDSPNIVMTNISSGGDREQYFDKWISLARLSGLTRLQFGAETNFHAANMGSSPAALPRVFFSIADGSGGGSVTCQCILNLTYKVQLYDRINLGQS